MNDSSLIISKVLGYEQKFKNIVGDNYVLTDEQSRKIYAKDWTRGFDTNPSLILLPNSVSQVSSIMKLCFENDLPVVPSGGRTGLAAGAVASKGEIVLSLERLRKIQPVDTLNMSLTVEAGVTTQTIQQVVQDAGLFFALDLAAKGSSQIGGNIATNAGGLKVIRYGMMREQVLGLKVVLADGTVLDLLRGLRKDNTGYDLKQLFIGSEGTLGIIVEATLKLHPKPRFSQLACVAVDEFTKIPKILHHANLQALQTTSFEFWTQSGQDLVIKYHPNYRKLFQNDLPYYALIEIDTHTDQFGQVIEPFLEKLFNLGLIQDAVVARSAAEESELWFIREHIPEAVSRCKYVQKQDVSVPISSLESFLGLLDQLQMESSNKSRDEQFEILVFGHIGDGNIHVNYISDVNTAGKFDIWFSKSESRVFSLIKEEHGSISAEHGIGLLKKKHLEITREKTELDFMRAIKRCFDSKGILNPGKIVDY